MIDDPIQVPSFQVGTITLSCYPASPQDLLEAFAAALVFSEDVVRVIKGANGMKGEKGDKGDRGERGEKGNDSSAGAKTTTFIPIAAGATYVEIPDTNVENHTLAIRSKREIAPAVGTVGYDYPAFDIATGYIGIGCIVEDMVNNRTRVYFTYAGAAITSVPHGDFQLIWIH